MDELELKSKAADLLSSGVPEERVMAFMKVGMDEISKSKPTVKPPVEAVKLPPSFGERAKQFAGETISNIPSSAIQYGKGIYEAVKSPIQTAKGVASVVKGAVESGTKADIIPKTFEENPQDIQNFEKFKQHFIDRYGGLEQAAETLKKDPVGFMGDLSAVLMGGGAVGGLKKVSDVGRAIEPLGVAGQIVKPIARVAGEMVSGALGTTTGAQYKNVRQALFNPNKEFTDAMRGKTGQTDIVEAAKSGLEELKNERRDAYVSKLQNIEQSTKQLDLIPIKQKVNDLLQKFRVKQIVNPQGKVELDFSRSPINKSASNDIQEMVDMVNDWGNQVDDTSPIGFDTLKRKLDGYYSDSSEAMAFTTDLKNSVKTQILKEVPEYNSMVKEYENASNQLMDIKKAFSLGGSAGADTIARKLTQTLRQNFGLREKMAKTLSKASGEDIQSMVAGYEMSTMEPKGLSRLGAMTVGGGLGSAVAQGALNPAYLGTLALSSPRLVGELLSALGYSGKAIGETLKSTYAPQRQVISQASKVSK